MNINKKLSFLGSKYFRNNNDFIVFKDWIKSNGNINPIFINRDEYNKIISKVTINTTLSVNGKSLYDLYLPNDLKKGEIFDIIYEIDKIINNKTTSNSTLSLLTTKIAISIAMLLKKNKNDSKLTESILEKSKKYISQTQLELIKNFKIKDYSVAKEIINAIKKEGNIFEYIENELMKSFDMIIFERGKKNIYDNLTSFSQKDYIELKDDESTQVKFKFDKKELYDEYNVKLSKKLRINYYKKLLNKYKNNEQKSVEIKKEFIELLYTVLGSFPFYSNSINTPNYILDKKIFSCLGHSTLAHVYLEKLGIKHFQVTITQHSSIVIQLTNKNYCSFDLNWLIYFNLDRNLKHNSDIQFINNGTKDIGYLSNPIYGLIASLYNTLGYYSKSLFFYFNHYVARSNLIINSKNNDNDLRIIIKQNSFGTNNLNLLGKYYEERNKYEKAIEIYKKAYEVRLNKKDEKNNLISIGRCYEKLGNKELSISYYQEAIKLGDNFFLYENISNIYEINGDKNNAIKYYIEFLKNIQGDDYLFNKKMIIFLNLLKKYGIGDKFNFYYNKITNFNINNEKDCKMKGIIFGEVGMLTKSIYYYKKALSLSNEKGTLYREVGKLYEKNNLLKKALIEYKKALKYSNNEFIYKDIANIYLKLGNNKKYSQYYTIFLEKLDIFDFEIYIEKYMKELINQKKYRIALIYLNKMIKKHGNKDYLYLYKGDLYFAMGKLKQALINYQKAIELDTFGYVYGLYSIEKIISINKLTNKSNMYYNKGKYYLSISKYYKAIEYFKKVIINDNIENKKLLLNMLDLISRNYNSRFK